MCITSVMLAKFEVVLLAMQKHVLALSPTLPLENETKVSMIDLPTVVSMSASQQEQLSTQLALIESALMRIHEGGFGECSVCGEQIDLGKLEVFPWTPFCFHCQERIEKEDMDDPRRAA